MNTLIDGIIIASVFLCLSAGSAQAGAGNLEEATALLGRVPDKLREYQVVLEPDKDQPEWWAYAEVAKSNESNEIRLFRLSR